MPRNRFLYFVFILLTIGLGLASRRITVSPQWVHLYLGDILWALMVFWGVGFLFSQKSSGFVASITLAFSIFIEISQLYHAEWIDTIRHTTLGGLILGFGFLWSDVICYTIGAAMGFVYEKIFCGNNNAKKYYFQPKI